MPLVIAWDKPFQFSQLIKPIEYIDLQFSVVSKFAISYNAVSESNQDAVRGSPRTLKRYALLGIVKWLFVDPLAQGVEAIIEYSESRLFAPPNSYGFQLWFQPGSFVDCEIVYGAGSGTGGGGMGDVTTAQLVALSDSVDTRFAAQAGLIENRALANHTHSQYVLNTDFSTVQAGLDSRIMTLETMPTSANGITNILSTSTYPSSPVSREIRNSNIVSCPTLLVHNGFAADAAFRGRYRMDPIQVTVNSLTPLLRFQRYDIPFFIPGSATTQWMLIRSWVTAYVDSAGVGFNCSARLAFNQSDFGGDAPTDVGRMIAASDRVLRNSNSTIRYISGNQYATIGVWFYSDNPLATAQVGGGVFLLERV